MKLAIILLSGAVAFLAALVLILLVGCVPPNWHEPAPATTLEVK